MTSDRRTGLSAGLLLCLGIACVLPCLGETVNPFSGIKNIELQKSGNSGVSDKQADKPQVYLKKSADDSISEVDKPCTLAVLSDLHVKKENMDMLQKTVREVNNLSGVFAVAILGDLCTKLGTKEELSLVVQAIRRFTVPIFAITGNHDYIYRDYLTKDKKKLRGRPADKKAKLERFRTALQQRSLRYSRKAGGHLLIFLPIDALKSAPLARLSDKTVDFLRDTLEKNPKLPTIIFCHAPLDGSYNQKGRMPALHASAQPADEISRILKKNPQVFLWVSGHLHISPSSKDNVSPTNKVGKVTVIHVPAVKTTSAWIKAIKLSPEAAVVKTYNVKTRKFVKKYERVFRHKVEDKAPAKDDSVKPDKTPESDGQQNVAVVQTPVQQPVEDQQDSEQTEEIAEPEQSQETDEGAAVDEIEEPADAEDPDEPEDTADDANATADDSKGPVMAPAGSKDSIASEEPEESHQTTEKKTSPEDNQALELIREMVETVKDFFQKIWSKFTRFIQP